MRTAEEIKAEMINKIASALQRPGMYTLPDSVDYLFLDKLDWILFADNRDINLIKLLEEDGLWGPLGARGEIWKICGELRCVDETASVYAQIGVSLGYVRPLRYLTNSEWRNVLKMLPSLRRRANVEPEKLCDLIGQPSLRIGNTFSLCAKVGLQVKWIHFDFLFRGNIQPQRVLERIRISNRGLAQNVQSAKMKLPKEERKCLERQSKGIPPPPSFRSNRDDQGRKRKE